MSAAGHRPAALSATETFHFPYLSFSTPPYARARWLRFQASPSPPTVFLVSRRATGCYERRQGRQAAASAEEKAALSAGEKAALSAAGHHLILTFSFGNRCCGWVNRCCGCLPCPCPTRRSADSTRLNTPGPEGFVSKHRLLRRPCFWFPGERPGRRHIRGAERNECPSCATRGETRPRRKGTITSTASGTLERETARGR